MRFPTLSNDKAKEILEAAIDGSLQSAVFNAGVTHAGSGPTIEVELLKRLTTRLFDLKESSRGDLAAFDAEACAILHSLLPQNPEVTSNDGFWRWLALGPLREIVFWRFPPKAAADAEPGAEPDRVFNRQNFGIGATARQRAECFPYKLWLRGELGYLPGDSDPYRFARRGDVDFWTSHVHRQSYTTNRALCSELVRVQYPDELRGNPRYWPGQENVAKGRFGVRTLAKRLRRLQASFELSILDAASLSALVLEQASGLTEAGARRSNG